MNAPNPKLVEALQNANDVPKDYVDTVEGQITGVGDAIKSDLFRINGRNYKKSASTIAALLMYSSEFRRFLSNKGMVVSSFDAFINQARELWQMECSKQPAGVKIIKPLREAARL